MLFGQPQTLRVKAKSLLQKVFTSYAKHYQLLNALDAKQLNFYHSDELITQYQVTVEQFGLESEGTIEVVFVNSNKDLDKSTERAANSVFIDSDVNNTTGGSGGHYSNKYADDIRYGRYTVEQIEVGPPIRSQNMESVDEDYFHSCSADGSVDTTLEPDAGIDDAVFISDTTLADLGDLADDDDTAVLSLGDNLENVRPMKKLSDTNTHVDEDDPMYFQMETSLTVGGIQNSLPSVKMNHDNAIAMDISDNNNPDNSDVVTEGSLFVDSVLK